jgi:hypothetical protein
VAIQNINCQKKKMFSISLFTLPNLHEGPIMYCSSDCTSAMKEIVLLKCITKKKWLLLRNLRDIGADIKKITIKELDRSLQPKKLLY